MHAAARRRVKLACWAAALFVSASALAWCVLPTCRAYQFAAAIEERDYAKAESLCEGAALGFPMDVGSPRQLADATVDVRPLTWNDITSGQRWVDVHIPYGDEMYAMDWDVILRATHARLEIVICMSRASLP